MFKGCWDLFAVPIEIASELLCFYSPRSHKGFGGATICGNVIYIDLSIINMQASFTLSLRAYGS